jgi:hypothetical protein
VFTVFEAREFRIPAEAEIRMARFLVHFEGEKKPRNFTIRPSNFATFAVDHDAVVLEPWLVRQKFAMVLADGHFLDGDHCLPGLAQAPTV